MLDFLEVDPDSGVNKKKMCAPVTPTKKERILWYVPDRIKDLLETVTVEMNVGLQFGGGVWITRAIQAETLINQISNYDYLSLSR